MTSDVKDGGPIVREAMRQLEVERLRVRAAVAELSYAEQAEDAESLMGIIKSTRDILLHEVQ
jgi:hypothetical protein